MDFIVEYIVKKKKDSKDYLYYGAIGVLAVIMLYVMMLLIPYVGDLYWGLSIGVIYGAYWLIGKRNIEFEYSFVNGDIEVDRIIARRKRRKIITVEVKAFKLFEQVNSGKGDSYPNIQRTINVAGDLQADNAYVAVLEHKGILTRLYFQASDRMLEYIKKYVKVR